ncbi:MAG: FG-GAP repeat protein, partial [Planctomycetes bacterium]|nr:FG-GAP repeat protein [Planctomycetota bacterium]
MQQLIMPLLAASAMVLSTAAAYADLGDQLFKLLANDGAAFDQFGNAVAISGATAIVGAFQDDDDNGFDSGSAYLFDTTTGRQIAKLLPDDGAALDLFGRSVALSGATAPVGP